MQLSFVVGITLLATALAQDNNSTENQSQSQSPAASSVAPSASGSSNSNSSDANSTASGNSTAPAGNGTTTDGNSTSNASGGADASSEGGVQIKPTSSPTVSGLAITPAPSVTGIDGAAGLPIPAAAVAFAVIAAVGAAL